MGDRFGKKALKWYMLIPAMGGILSIPFGLGAIFLPDTQMALFSFFPAVALGALYLAPSIAISHNLVPSNMRAFASSILFFVLNIIGLGGGPLFVGQLSDYFKTTVHSEQALQYALGAAVLSSILATVFFLMASRTLKEDLEQED